jgi:hypothetical protein
MFLGNLNLGQMATGLPTGLFDRALAEERTALAQAPASDRAAHLRQRIATLSFIRDTLVREADNFRKRLQTVGDAALRATISNELALMEKLLALSTGVITELNRQLTSGVYGLGAGGSELILAVSELGAGQILAISAGLALAVILLVTAITGHDKLVEMFPNITEAVKTGVTIAAVAGGAILSIWIARVIRDIWERPRRGFDEGAARAAAEAAAARRVVALSPR